MRNPTMEMMKAFSEECEYQERIVAFVDVMGIKDRINTSVKPQDFKMYSILFYMFANQPFAEGKLKISMFSDCMYIVSEKENIDLVICLLANFAHKMLFNNLPVISFNKDGTHTEENHFDCFKLRGGITFGKVCLFDEEGKKSGVNLNSNILFGKGITKAYELESKESIYPRIIVDDSFLNLIDTNGKTYSDYYLIKDTGNKYYYLDFLDYMCQGKRENSLALYGLEDCIEFVSNELKDALNKGNAKLVGQLLWYKQYLENHLAINSKGEMNYE